VALGTDGAASNNRLDVMTEMRTAALLAKGPSGDAAVVDAHTARAHGHAGRGRSALGLEAEIGSIEPGKQADPHRDRAGRARDATRCFDPVSTSCTGAGREHVSHVWVGGEARLEARAPHRARHGDLHDRAVWWQSRLS
jgi:5-methylthioadenosine/S-adenosylhomocysteine deaminase